MTGKAKELTADQVMSTAIAAHQAGKRPQAQKLYQDVLRLRPQDAQALYLLGAIYYEQKSYAPASECLEKSLAIRPGHGPTHSLLGVVYSLMGQFDKAISHLQNVVKSAPQSVDAHYNLARALLEKEDFDAAALSYQKALDLKPDHGASLNGLVASYQGQGRNDLSAAYLRSFVEKYPNNGNAWTLSGRIGLETKDDAYAAEALQKALSLDPNNANALLMLGNLRHRQGSSIEAEAFFRRLLVIAPDDPAVNNYLGAALLNQGRLGEAESQVRKAYGLKPDDAEILTNLGLILQERGKTSEAAEFQRRALALKPEMAEAWNNLGINLQNSGDWAGALDCYEQAVKLKPEFHGAKTNKAHALLALGRLDEAWQIYRYRFDQKVWASKRRSFPYPQWTGEADAKLKLLLWTDQGLGDEVLYTSMITEATKLVGHCILECSRRMVPLFQRSFPDITVVPRTTPTDSRIEALHPDAQLSLIELGELLRPSIAAIPSHQGYLKPDPLAQSELRKKYESLAQGRRIVGVSWKSESPRTGLFKSIPLSQWAPILNMPGVLFVSLQYGETRPELADVKTLTGIDILHDDDVDALQNPDLSAAQIATMDLVITTSNTTAHFAGAMNVPVWTLIPTGPGVLWYWFLERSDSPWYPSMRLYRQPQPGAWAPVIAGVADDFKAWSAL